MDIIILLINAINGLIWGIILGAAAMGLTLLWGVMKVVNIAHGESLLLGVYLTIILYVSFGLSPIISLFLALGIGILAGTAIYWALLHKLIGKVEIITLRTEMSTLLIMFALSVAMYNYYYFTMGGEPRGIGTWTIGESSYINIGIMNIRTNNLLAAIICISSVIAIHLFLTKTMIGKSIRAVMQDAQAASLVGINPVMIKFLTCVISIGITAFAGVSVLLYESAITPDIAYKYAPVGFVTVVLGGLGSILGSLTGGIILGLIYGISKFVFSTIYSPTVSDPLALSIVFIVMILVLLFKPEGLFGRRE